MNSKPGLDISNFNMTVCCHGRSVEASWKPLGLLPRLWKWLCLSDTRLRGLPGPRELGQSHASTFGAPLRWSQMHWEALTDCLKKSKGKLVVFSQKRHEKSGLSTCRWRSASWPLVVTSLFCSGISPHAGWITGDRCRWMRPLLCHCKKRRENYTST